MGDKDKTMLESVLQGGGPAYDVLQVQLLQGAVSRYNQMEQAALNDQRWAANAVQLLSTAMLGKAATSFPKSVVEDVVSETVSRNSANQEDTSKDTLDNMVSRVDSVEDMVTRSVADLQTQMTDVIATLGAVLGRIEIEAE